jgi:hypothetical protein
MYVPVFYRNQSEEIMAMENGILDRLDSATLASLDSGVVNAISSNEEVSPEGLFYSIFGKPGIAENENNRVEVMESAEDFDSAVLKELGDEYMSDISEGKRDIPALNDAIPVNSDFFDKEVKTKEIDLG